VTHADDGDHERRDSDVEPADRRYTELLQELRVAQTGVQILFAFLLTLAFSQRFAQITDFPTWLYVGTLLAASVAAALLIGPAPAHRTLYRRGLEPRLVAASDRMIRAGLAGPMIAISAILLVLDVVLGGWLPFLLTVLTTTWFVLIWYVVPKTVRERPLQMS
jgi:hypothetical protein